MMEILQRGDASAFAAQMHYPPTYTPEERAKDIKGTGDGIDLALRELGSLSDVHPFSGSSITFDFSTTGGTVPYVASLSPSFSADYNYQVRYHVSGAGYIYLTVVRLTAQSPLEVLRVRFQLPVSDPRTFSELSSLFQKELELNGVKVTPDIKRQIEASIKPSANGGGR